MVLQDTPKVRALRGPMRWLFELTGFSGLCLPPIGIWLHPDLMTWQRAGHAAPAPGTEADRLLRHELAHWAQAQRFGVIGFYARYLAGLLRYGYRNHPLEIEARAAAQAPPGA
jgi:hypothetical protein